MPLGGLPKPGGPSKAKPEPEAEPEAPSLEPAANEWLRWIELFPPLPLPCGTSKLRLGGRPGPVATMLPPPAAAVAAATAAAAAALLDGVGRTGRAEMPSPLPCLLRGHHTARARSSYTRGRATRMHRMSTSASARCRLSCDTSSSFCRRVSGTAGAADAPVLPSAPAAPPPPAEGSTPAEPVAPLAAAGSAAELDRDVLLIPEATRANKPPTALLREAPATPLPLLPLPALDVAAGNGAADGKIASHVYLPSLLSQFSHDRRNSAIACSPGMRRSTATKRPCSSG